MKRIYLSAAAIAAVAVVTLTAGGQTPAPAPTAAAARGTAVFNVAKVMKDYQKWQYFAKSMNDEKNDKAAALAKMQNEMITLDNAMKVETVATKRDEMTQQLTVLQRKFEDAQKQIRKEIDDKSAAHLRTLFAEIRTVVDAVAKTNGFDLVLAYPDALTAEEMNSPLYFEMKLRSPAAMPFYVSPSIDISTVVVQTLNKNFPAPGPVPGVSPAGATAPAAPPMK